MPTMDTAVDPRPQRRPRPVPSDAVILCQDDGPLTAIAAA